MNYYDILGINQNASQKEIKNAYKKLIKKYHPDIYNGDKSFAEKKTQEINQAYDILSNPETKKDYDEQINYTPAEYDNYTNQTYNNYYNQYSYTENMHDTVSDNIVKSINKLSFNKKIILISVIICLYIIFLIYSFIQFNSLFNKSSNDFIVNTTSTQPSTIYNDSEEDYYDDEYDDLDESFDINDYISEEALQSLYQKYYTNEYDSYSEFREAISDYIYYNYF